MIIIVAVLLYDDGEGVDVDADELESGEHGLGSSRERNKEAGGVVSEVANLRAVPQCFDLNEVSGAKQ